MISPTNSHHFRITKVHCANSLVNSKLNKLVTQLWFNSSIIVAASIQWLYVNLCLTGIRSGRNKHSTVKDENLIKISQRLFISDSLFTYPFSGITAMAIGFALPKYWCTTVRCFLFNERTSMVPSAESLQYKLLDKWSETKLFRPHTIWSI